MPATLGNNGVSVDVVARKLRRDIEGSSLGDGDRLQPLRKLADKYNVSYLTMRRAINQLSGEGILYSKRGSGVYVKVGSSDQQGRIDSSEVLTFAMVFCGMEHHVTTSIIYSKLLHSVENSLTSLGHNLVVSQLNDVEAFKETAVYRDSDGLLLLGDDSLPGLEKLLADKPFLWVMGPDKKWGDHITYNDKSVGRVAAEFALSRDHKNMASFNIDHLSGVERCGAFKEHAEKHGANVISFYDKEALIVNKHEQRVDHDIISEWIDEIVSLPDSPTVIFVNMDSLAVVVHNILIEKGLRPGKDVEIISCNNEEALTAGLFIKPSSVDLHAEDVGRLAVQHLQWKISNPTTARVVTKIEPTMSIRDF